MFINSKKRFEINEGDQKLVIPRNYIGSIPDWAADHWLVQAAITDGSIATPDGKRDRDLVKADETAGEKAEEFDLRPDGTEEEKEKPVKASRKEKIQEG